MKTSNKITAEQMEEAIKAVSKYKFKHLRNVNKVSTFKHLYNYKVTSSSYDFISTIYGNRGGVDNQRIEGLKTKIYQGQWMPDFTNIKCFVNTNGKLICVEGNNTRAVLESFGLSYYITVIEPKTLEEVSMFNNSNTRWSPEQHFSASICDGNPFTTLLFDYLNKNYSELVHGSSSEKKFISPNYLLSFAKKDAKHIAGGKNVATITLWKEFEDVTTLDNELIETIEMVYSLSKKLGDIGLTRIREKIIRYSLVLHWNVKSPFTLTLDGFIDSFNYKSFDANKHTTANEIKNRLEELYQKF
jgi:hypothetical protein